MQLILDSLIAEGVVKDDSSPPPLNTTWIPVEDSLPEVGETVLTYNPACKFVKYAVMCYIEWHERPVNFSSQTIVVDEWFEEDDEHEITHWMRLGEKL